MTFRALVAGKTDAGRVRENNEDWYGFDLDAGLFVVCDGVGGQVAGEVASRVAVDTILKRYSQLRAQQAGSNGQGPARGRMLLDALQAANAAILQQGSGLPDQCGMGATVVAAAAEGDQVSIAYLGDSRAYLIRDRRLQLLTEDHSLVAAYVKAGVLTPEEAACSRLQHIILRALGCDRQVEPDLRELTLRSGDVLLLCTDGLSKPVSGSSILKTVTDAPDLEAACTGLIEAAVSAGGEDNITAVLVKVV